jgi:sugar phosphate isomerase/epimerase
MPPLAVCSWSLQPTGPADLAAKVRACGLDAVQLALDPIRTGEWDEAETARALAGEGIIAVSGMMGAKGEDYSTLDTIKATGGVRPDATWPSNLAAAHANADLAARLGLRLVTLHAGFLPHDPADPERGRMLDRLAQVIEAFGARGVGVAFETGQESADTLLGVLAELPGAGVNFDPANMILYAMGDPIESLRKLAPHVAQIHIKDANPTAAPGTWGSEQAAGTGSVDWGAFFAVYREAGLGCGLVIEREAGNSRIEDVRTAAALVRGRGSFLRLS